MKNTLTFSSCFVVLFPAPRFSRQNPLQVSRILVQSKSVNLLVRKVLALSSCTLPPPPRRTCTFCLRGLGGGGVQEKWAIEGSPLWLLRGISWPKNSILSSVCPKKFLATTWRKRFFRQKSFLSSVNFGFLSSKGRFKTLRTLHWPCLAPGPLTYWGGTQNENQTPPKLSRQASFPMKTQFFSTSGTCPPPIATVHKSTHNKNVSNWNTFGNDGF